jgi:uncharacterized protein YecT (DUF1311 family)
MKRPVTTMVLLLVLAAAGAGTMPAAVAEQGEDPCLGAVTTIDMVTCAGQDLEAADTALGKVYDGIIESLIAQRDEMGYAENDPVGLAPVATLRGAQASWHSFRDAQCAFERTLMYGGSLGRIIELTCRADMAKRRAEELVATLEMFR